MGSSAWDKNEQRLLEDGLRYYPHDKHSNMFIYIRIAAQLPKKTVRDVAHHLRHMQVSPRGCLVLPFGARAAVAIPTPLPPPLLPPPPLLLLLY